MINMYHPLFFMTFCVLGIDNKIQDALCMCIFCLNRILVHILYFPFVSPAYQTELKQFNHNNMKCSYNGCFLFYQENLQTSRFSW